MIALRLTREVMNASCCRGKLDVLDADGEIVQTLFTIEKPWLPNSNGGLAGEPFRSCVSEGTYSLSPFVRPNGDKVWMLANPELDVWVVTGDGDGLSIGGNHMLHVLRRNVDLNIILFNNEIYGLTKGQYSPTSRRGTRSPSTPLGSIENPVSACAFALGAGARFVARSIDTQQAHLIATLKRAHAHQGASFVEILQNCVVFNDAVFENITGKEVAPDAQVLVEHGKPLLFGKNKEKGLRLKPGKLELEIVPAATAAPDVLVHDETNRPLAQLLAALEPPFPVAMGVLYCNPAASYEREVYAQKAAPKGSGDLDALLNSERTWEVVP